jgi:hypothetical protein
VARAGLQIYLHLFLHQFFISFIDSSSQGLDIINSFQIKAVIIFIIIIGDIPISTLSKEGLGGQHGLTKRQLAERD